MMTLHCILLVNANVKRLSSSFTTNTHKQLIHATMMAKLPLMFAEMLMQEHFLRLNLSGKGRPENKHNPTVKGSFLSIDFYKAPMHQLVQSN
jgi:hypothetical protein